MEQKYSLKIWEMDNGLILKKIQVLWVIQGLKYC